MNVEVSNGDCVTIMGPEQWDIFLSLTVKCRDVLWDRDITNELATSPNPTNPPVWWKRRPDQIDVLTIHHTLSDSPHATFENYIRTRHRPTGPYAIWITQTGDALLCVDPELGIWHDHTGFYVKQDGRKLWGNSHLSVGMAGRLHEYVPADVQLRRTVKFVADVIKGDMFPSIDSIDCIKGHMDYYPTQCPGWWETEYGRRIPGGDRWETRFYDMIREELNDN